jgi:hypothetical protein
LHETAPLKRVAGETLPDKIVIACAKEARHPHPLSIFDRERKAQDRACQKDADAQGR